jgi:phage baseplate assembly protein W
MSSSFLGTGLAFPLGVDARGSLALADGEEDVQQAIGIILGTAPGERPMRPEFGCGIHAFLFDTVDGATLSRIELEIRAALERWEPRIEVVAIEFDLARVDRGEIQIDLGYVLRATNDFRNLVYPFYVIPEEEGGA